MIMTKRFMYLIFVGFIGLIFVLLFGIKGMYSLNLGFLTQFIFKHKADEREKIIISKNYSQVFGFLFIIFINGYILANFVELGEFLTRNWIGIIVLFVFLLL